VLNSHITKEGGKRGREGEREEREEKDNERRVSTRQNEFRRI